MFYFQPIRNTNTIVNPRQEIYQQRVESMHTSAAANGSTVSIKKMIFLQIRLLFFLLLVFSVLGTTRREKNNYRSRYR